MTVTRIGEPLPDLAERDWVGAMELIDLAGITYRQLDYWTRTGLLNALDGDTPGSGYRRWYDMSAVRRAVTIGALVHAGFSLQLCRQIIDEFMDQGRIEVGPFTLIAREAS